MCVFAYYIRMPTNLQTFESYSPQKISDHIIIYIDLCVIFLKSSSIVVTKPSIFFVGPSRRLLPPCRTAVVVFLRLARPPPPQPRLLPPKVDEVILLTKQSPSLHHPCVCVLGS
ncbi:hypothetical protein VPH35_038448 [Triticum aestivum]|uniref:Uncharacterized protein n=1 Tax=Aegilops tauschii subsp. strangulata TaxID=200361 RepID=A0A453CCS6_AEGTS